jgi:ABC-2 type transport system permease protein
MRGAWAVYKRELLAAFCSPVAYVVLVSFLLFNGMIFYFFMKITASQPAPTLTGTRGPLQMFFGSTILSVLTPLVFCPALTMRTFAEERRSRTLETLLTAPVTDLAVVCGKYLGAFTVYASLWVPTLLYALVVRRYGPVDWSGLAAAYAGTLLVGGAFLAVGVLMSALARSQVTAFLASFLVIGGAMFALGLGSYIFTDNEALRRFFSYVNLWEHMEHFSVGVVDSRAVVYYGSVVALCLGFTTQALGSTREAG